MRRVLVVDDNEGLVEDLVEVLEGEGHEVRGAYDGRTALEHARGFAFQLALVDIRMPGMDGVALVRQLMSIQPRSHYLFMTGYSSDQTLSEAMALSQRAVLEKPLDLDRLIRLVAGSG